MIYYLYDDSPYLMHHGVKGMHWGVRKDRNHSGGRASRPRRGSKKPLTAAQKAERKRKLIKGAKIAAAALGTAAVAGRIAYGAKQRRENARVNAEIARLKEEDFNQYMRHLDERLARAKSRMPNMEPPTENETYEEMFARNNHNLERMGMGMEVSSIKRKREKRKRKRT